MFDSVRGFFMKDIAAIVVLSIVAFLLVAELFFIPAQPQTFDEWSHLLTINGFARSLSFGSLPVSWVTDVSNYGAPLGQISHQTTSYIGATFLLLTGSTIVSYNLTMLVGSIAGTLLLYYFLRLHFSQLASVLGAILFTFTPYRITNIYVRGALPEFFAAACIPIVLIGVHKLFIQKSISGLVWIFLGSTLLALSHPMMIVIGFSLVAWYLLYVFFEQKNWKLFLRYFFSFIATVTIGTLIASYYLLPLVLEIKYFHHGGIAISRDEYYFLSPDAFFKEVWNYSNFESVGIRENRLQLGSIEALSILTTIAIVLYKRIKKQTVPSLLYFWLAATLVYIFLMLPPSSFLYEKIFLLSGIQFPWRFLTTLTLISPVCIAYILDTFNYKKIIFAMLIVLLIVLRIPQLYAKNYTAFSESRYAFSIVNPHDTDMNSVWSEDSYKYPRAENNAAIIEGEGSIAIEKDNPTQRSYIIYADTDVRMIEHTFYFPGWELYIDGNPSEIVYQDPSYRGVITYRVPAGTHSIQLMYEDTKARLIGKILSSGALGLSVVTLAAYQIASKKQRAWLKEKLGLIE